MVWMLVALMTAGNGKEGSITIMGESHWADDTGGRIHTVSVILCVMLWTLICFTLLGTSVITDFVVTLDTFGMGSLLGFLIGGL
jgi:hypothetical protein